MMFYRTDDPHRDFDRYEDRRQRAIDRRPHCCECGEPIMDDHFYEFEDGKYICPECLEDNHRKWTEDYIEGEM